MSSPTEHGRRGPRVGSLLATTQFAADATGMSKMGPTRSAHYADGLGPIVCGQGLSRATYLIAVHALQHPRANASGVRRVTTQVLCRAHVTNGGDSDATSLLHKYGRRFASPRFRLRGTPPSHGACAVARALVADTAGRAHATNCRGLILGVPAGAHGSRRHPCRLTSALGGVSVCCRESVCVLGV